MKFGGILGSAWIYSLCLFDNYSYGISKAKFVKVFFCEIIFARGRRDLNIQNGEITKTIIIIVINCYNLSLLFKIASFFAPNQ